MNNGDEQPPTSSASPSSSAATRPPLDEYDGLRYNLSTVKVFQKCIVQSDVLANLVALGPDCTNLTRCQIGDIWPNFGHLNPHKCANNIAAVNSTTAIEMLHKNLRAVFSAADPSILLGFPVTESADEASIGEQMGIITFGQPASQRPIQSLQSATVLCGGLATLLYLFARVVELSDCEFNQSSALTFLLRTAHSNAALYTEFNRGDYMSLIGPIIKSSRCRKGMSLLNSILEVACDQPVLTKRATDTTCHVISTTNSCILYADLLVSVITRYSDWHVVGGEGAPVIEVLLTALQALCREKHPRQELNIARLTRAGLVPALLHFCKYFLVGIPQPVQLSASAAQSLVGLISIFAGAPPASALLDDVVKVLLLLHRPSDSFVTHDRSKFYFALSPVAPGSKTKRIAGLPVMVTRKMSSTTRRDRKYPPAAATTRRTESIVSADVHVDGDVDELKVVAPIELAVAAGTSSEGRGSEVAELSDGMKQKRLAAAATADKCLDEIMDFSRESDRKVMSRMDASRLDKAVVQSGQQSRRQMVGKKKIVRRTHQRTRSRSSRRNSVGGFTTTTTDSETDGTGRRKAGKLY